MHIIPSSNYYDIDAIVSMDTEGSFQLSFSPPMSVREPYEPPGLQFGAKPRTNHLTGIRFPRAVAFRN